MIWITVEGCWEIITIRDLSCTTRTAREGWLSRRSCLFNDWRGGWRAIRKFVYDLTWVKVVDERRKWINWDFWLILSWGKCVSRTWVLRWGCLGFVTWLNRRCLVWEISDAGVLWDWRRVNWITHWKYGFSIDKITSDQNSRWALVPESWYSCIGFQTDKNQPFGERCYLRDMFSVQIKTQRAEWFQSVNIERVNVRQIKWFKDANGYL